MKPLHVVLFYCVNCVDITAVKLGCQVQGVETVSTVSLPCSGKVTLVYLLKAFETGADGVFLMTCQKPACRFLEGSSRAEKRVRAVDELLDEAGLGKDRITVVQMQDRDRVDQAVSEVVQFVRSINTMAGQAA